MFKVGEKVICVNDRYNNADIYQKFGFVALTWKFPKLGEIYTVDRVSQFTITVEEIKNTPCALGVPEFFFYHFEKLPEDAVLMTELEDIAEPVES